MRRRHAGLLVLLLGAVACGDEASRAPPPSFQRPNRVAFVCISVAREAVVSPDCCRDDPRARPAFCAAPDYDLHALVTQSARGEVAAVNLDENKVVDSRRDVPGYTFVPVGELPSAIVVPARNPKVTYVANYGSRDIYVLRTQAFLSLPPGENPVLQVVRIGDRSSAAGPIDAVLSPDEDALFVAVPGLGAVLRMPLRDCAAGDCQRGLIDEDAITRIDLARSAALAPATPPALAASNDYARMCGYPRAAAPVGPAPDVASAARVAAPHPVSFAVDAFCRAGTSCARRLLVADDAQPWIHVIDLDAVASGAAEAVVEPIFAGVPTTAVVITPRVPATPEPDDTRETQYVYAVDATDGSVLAMEDGRVLSIDADPAGRPDRVPLRPRDDGTRGTMAAAALSVFTPQFDPTGPAAQYVQGHAAPSEARCDDSSPLVDPALCLDCDHPREDPRRLRGVFLAVAMTDGSVRVVDVHDMELAASDGGHCRACPDTPIPVLLRHHPRLAVNFLPIEPDDEEPDLVPRLVAVDVRAQDRRFVLRSDGTTNTPDVPGLACIDCAAASSGVVVYDHVFPPPQEFLPDAGAAPDDDAGLPDGGARDGGVRERDTPVGFERCSDETPSLLCGITDPWFATEETWQITWEGALPDTATGDGRFLPARDPDNLSGRVELLAGDRHLCGLGVEDGDQVVLGVSLIDARLVPKGADEDCDRIREALDRDTVTPLRLPIEHALDDRIVLGERLIEAVDGTRFRAETLARCARDVPVAFHVRARDGYTVIGSRSGFVHAVTRDPDGRCVVPPGADPLRSGRAYAGALFQNGRVAFTPREPEPDSEPRLGGNIRFAFQSPARKLAFDATQLRVGSTLVMPAQLRYSETDQRLYLVDILSRGLVPIPVDPFVERSPDSLQ